MYVCLEVFNLPAKFRRNVHTFHKTSEGPVVSHPFMGNEFVSLLKELKENPKFTETLKKSHMERS